MLITVGHDEHRSAGRAEERHDQRGARFGGGHRGHRRVFRRSCRLDALDSFHQTGELPSQDPQALSALRVVHTAVPGGLQLADLAGQARQLGAFPGGHARVPGQAGVLGPAQRIGE